MRVLTLAALSITLLLVGCDSTSTNDDGLGPVTLTIVATDYAFEPSELSVAAGEVTFAIRNDGAEEHEFEILQGDRVIDEVEGLVPGLERDLTVELAAGEYQFACLLADHFERGMHGTLTITD
jgi:iron uptake system component EfeO